MPPIEPGKSASKASFARRRDDVELHRHAEDGWEAVAVLKQL